MKIVTNSHIDEVINMSRAQTVCSEEFVLPRIVSVRHVPDLMAEYLDIITDELPELWRTLVYEGITYITEDTFIVRLTFACNEAERETLTIKLRTAIQLLLEGDAGVSSDKTETDGAGAKH